MLMDMVSVFCYPVDSVSWWSHHFNTWSGGSQVFLVLDTLSVALTFFEVSFSGIDILGDQHFSGPDLDLHPYPGSCSE